jgi:hypothetical protein
LRIGPATLMPAPRVSPICGWHRPYVMDGDINGSLTHGGYTILSIKGAQALDSVKNTTCFTKKLYYDYYWFTIRRSLVSIYFLFVFAVVAAYTAYFLSEVVSYGIYGSGYDMLLLIIFIWVLVAFIVARLVSFSPRRAFKKVKEITGSYSFDGEFFEADSTRPLADGHSRYQYEAIRRAYERKCAFYIFIDRHRAFVVDKNGFTQGGPEDLRNILAAKLGKKFKKRGKQQ